MRPYRSGWPLRLAIAALLVLAGLLANLADWR